MSDFESRLRAMLRERAEDVQPGPGLSDRIIATAQNPGTVTDLGRARALRRHSLFPLLAAAAVVVLVVGVLLASRLGSHHDGDPAAPGPKTPSTSGPPVPSSSPPSSPSPSTSPSRTVPSNVHIANFLPSDLTWVGDNDGYALGTGDCLSGSGRCTALVHTSDGANWFGVHGTTPFNIAGSGCTVRCVDGIRFADDQTGYVFGPDVLFMTTDGGGTWQLQAGGASYLEVADNVVLRIAPGATNSLLRSQTGSATWTTLALPTQQGLVPQPVALARSTNYVFVAEMIGDHAQYLAWSDDDGATWRNGGRACPTLGLIQRMAVGADGSSAWVCGGTTANPSGAAEIRTSTDGARTSQATSVPGAGADVTGIAALGSGRYLYSRAPSGARPTLTEISTGSSGVVIVTGTVGVDATVSTFLGCESASVCRWAPGGGNGIYTSRDHAGVWQHDGF